MITLEELLGRHNIDDCTVIQKTNLNNLLTKLNQLRTDWNKSMIITSGLRNDLDMKRIYGSDKYPHGSKHLLGQACDLKDDGSLMLWLKENNSERMKKYGLWGEEGTNGWVHVQSVSMGSYNKVTDIRWFIP